MEGPNVASGTARGLQHLRPEQAAGMNESLAAVKAHLPGDGRDGVVGHGQNHELRRLEHGRRLDEGASAGDKETESLPTAGVTAGHGRDRPTGPADCHAQCRSDGPGPDYPNLRYALHPTSIPDRTWNILAK